jgi:hypothetical protein
MTVTQMDGGEAKPTGSPFAEAPAPAAKAKAAVDAVDEPVKRTSAKKAEVKDVSSVLDEWADDAE